MTKINPSPPKKPKREEMAKSECLEFINILTEFIDADLTENRLIAMRSHLSTCLKCTKIYRDLRILIQLCHNETVEEPETCSWQLWQVLEKKFRAKKL
jgi:hypothetical protein|uniref:Zinc-finger domain-containing protein n=1 Tax=candidate division WOR-3 bacterium TaxID=2052148 RepID=A0A7C6EGD8_UNCW3